MSSVLFDAPGPKARRRHAIAGVLTVVGVLVVLGVILWRFYTQDQLTMDKWEPFVTPNLMLLLLEGVWDTVKAAGIAILVALVFGIVFGVGKLSDHAFVRWPCWLVVEFFRAVPLFMMILFFFIAYGTSLGSTGSLILGLVLYNGSVLAEVFRAGILAVPKGQAEAAYALGMRKTQVTTVILLPQAIKIMLPSIVSQCVVALKDTSLGYPILAAGVSTVGREIWRTFDNRLATALVLALIYIVLNSILTWIAGRLQRRITGEQARQMNAAAGARGTGQAGANASA